MTRPVIALDADGVLLDYRKAFPSVFFKAFGKELPLVREDAYHAHNAYGLAGYEMGTELGDRFFAHFDDDAWCSMPTMDGALEACHKLAASGYDLVCVTSIPSRFTNARIRNLQAHGFPISQVHATGRVDHENPKLEVLLGLKPVALVDDLATNFLGLGPDCHKALVDYGNYDSPNRELDLSIADSHHAGLLAFVDWWLANLH